MKSHLTIVAPAFHEVFISPFANLPFVHQSARDLTSINHWHVAPTNDYAEACAVGREYAAHFAQFMKDSPQWVGSNVLGRIVADMDFSDDTCAAGYHVGFFAHLESLIHGRAASIDVFADVADVNAENARLAERSVFDAGDMEG